MDYLVGSSSGSAVAVSANIVPLSIGTETDTSIIGPASINGVVGIKPTVGLTSRAGVIPSSLNLDTVGPIGRTVLDAVRGLSVIAEPRQDYSRFIGRKESLVGAKFGLLYKRCHESIPKRIQKHAECILGQIIDAGAEVIRTDFPCAEERIPEDGSWDWYGLSI